MLLAECNQQKNTEKGTVLYEIFDHPKNLAKLTGFGFFEFGLGSD